MANKRHHVLHVCNWIEKGNRDKVGQGASLAVPRPRGHGRYCCGQRSNGSPPFRSCPFVYVLRSGKVFKRGQRDVLFDGGRSAYSRPRLLVRGRLYLRGMMKMIHRMVTVVFCFGFWLLTVCDGFAQNVDYFRFENRWKPDQYLNIEHGQILSIPIQPQWYSAMWSVENVDAGFVRLRNRWKPNEFIHIEYGAAQSGPIQPQWFSAMWAFGGNASILPRLQRVAEDIASQGDIAPRR